MNKEILLQIMYCLPDYWVTGDGRLLKINEMSDNHIINCLKRMKRVAIKSNEEWINEVPMTFHVMMEEIENRGLNYDPNNDIYEKVKGNKLRRRKLGEVRKIIEKLKQTRKIDLD